MSTPFLCGLLAAWAIAQVAVGAFFCLAYALGRREDEYLLFGLLTLALAVATSGFAMEYAATSFAVWRMPSMITDLGYVIAIPVHLHFLMRYARTRFATPIALGVYVLALVFAVLRISGLWLVPGSEAVRVSRVFGHEVVHLTMDLRPHALGFLMFGGLTLVAGTVLLLLVYRSGTREALFAMLGSLLPLIAAVNDLLLVSGTYTNTVFLLPHAFLVYAFAIATTLLVRYRSAAGQLEQTTSSLRERTAELRLSYDELNVMEDELVKQQQLAAVGELAASIAHEVRNPLAVIVNATASLRRSGTDQQQCEALLDMLDEESARLNGLVTDLLRFSRPMTPTLSEVDLVELTERAGRMVDGEHELVVSIADDPEVSRVSVDPALLRLALENLIENACQAMPDGGTIRISTTRGRLDGVPCVRLEIRDEGHGMKPEVKQRALDPFFTTRPTGTGLGLPIVQRIMEAHGGEVTVESEPGSGTTVGLLIPEPEAREEAVDRPSRRPRLRRKKAG